MEPGDGRRAGRGLPTPPGDGQPLAVDLYLRQHEVQVVCGRDGRLAAAWADDTAPTGMRGWVCRYSASMDGGRTWTAPLDRSRDDFPITGNPTIAMDAKGAIYAVAMSVEQGYARGVLDFARSTDAGLTWSAWKTVASVEDGIPDRPKLLAVGDGNLHLAFAGIERTRRKWTVLKSTIRMMSSDDGGDSWTGAQAISTGDGRSRWFIDGHQGVALREAPGGGLLASWADYYGNRAWFSSRGSGTIDMEQPVPMRLKAAAGTGPFTWVLGATFGTPCTELAVDAGGSQLAISVHEAHAMGRIALAVSDDGGRTWTRRRPLSACGTNACVRFDPSGRLHALWTERRKVTVDVVYAVSDDLGRSFCSPMSLAGTAAPVDMPGDAGGREEVKLALGSYQSLVLCPDGRAMAFWIDLRNGMTKPQLFQSAWDV